MIWSLELQAKWLAAAGGIVVMLSALEWLGMISQVPAGPIVVAFAMFGLARAAIRRPTMIATIVEADQQLELNDLLASAMLCGGANSSTQPMIDSLRMLAESKTSNLRSSSVRLGRSGMRAWGGLVLIWMLAVVLSLAMPSNESLPKPNAASATKGQSIAMNQTDRPLVDLLSPSDGGLVVRPDPEDPSASKFGQSEKSTTQPSSLTAPQDVQASKRTSLSDGSGPGMAQSRQPISSDIPNRDRPNANSTEPDLTASQESTGSGRASDKTRLPVGDPSHRSGTIAAADSRPPVPPWQSTQWPSDIGRARQVLDSGQVPSAYRDMVRAYFQ